MKKLLIAFGLPMTVLSSLIAPEATAIVFLAGMVSRAFSDVVVSPQASPEETCPDVLCRQTKGSIVCRQGVPAGVTTISQISLVSEFENIVDVIPPQNSYINKAGNVTTIFWKKGQEPKLYLNFVGKHISLVINYATENLKTAMKFLITMDYCSTVLRNKCQKNKVILDKIISIETSRDCYTQEEMAMWNIINTHFVLPICGSIMGVCIILLGCIKLREQFNKKNIANGDTTLLNEDHGGATELRVMQMS